VEAARRISRWSSRATSRHKAAHVRHAWTQSSIPPIAAQSFSQVSHTSAQSDANRVWNWLLRPSAPAVKAQNAAQSSINRRCWGRACSPPNSRQWVIAIEEHIALQWCSAEIASLVCRLRLFMLVVPNCSTTRTAHCGKRSR